MDRLPITERSTEKLIARLDAAANRITAVSNGIGQMRQELANLGYEDLRSRRTWKRLAKERPETFKKVQAAVAGFERATEMIDHGISMVERELGSSTALRLADRAPGAAGGTTHAQQSVRRLRRVSE